MNCFGGFQCVFLKITGKHGFAKTGSIKQELCSLFFILIQELTLIDCSNQYYLFIICFASMLKVA